MPFSSLVNGSSTGNEGTCALRAPRNVRPVPHSLSNHAPSPVPRARLPRASGQPAAWLCPLGNCHWNLANTRLRRCAFMPSGCSSSMPVAMCAFARDGKGAGPQSAVVAGAGRCLGRAAVFHNDPRVGRTKHIRCAETGRHSGRKEGGLNLHSPMSLTDGGSEYPNSTSD